MVHTKSAVGWGGREERREEGVEVESLPLFFFNEPSESIFRLQLSTCSRRVE